MSGRARLAATIARNAARSLVAAHPWVLMVWPPAYREHQRKHETAQNQLTDHCPDGAFFLYLRSFSSDLPTTETWELRAADGTLIKTLQNSPQSVLEFLLQEAGPLIEVGGPKHSGLGQVKVADADWWVPAESLIIHSTANFLNPGDSKGLEKEVELILRHRKLKKRTFLIMEPTHETMLSAAYQQDRTVAAERKARWDKVVKIFRSHRIKLPDYHPCGAVISLHKPRRKIEFADLSRDQLHDLMKEFGVDPTKRGSYHFKPRERCPCGSGLAYGRCHGRKVAAGSAA